MLYICRVFTRYVCDVLSPRETLQQYKILRASLVNLVKKCLARCAAIAHGVADSEDIPPNISRWTLQPHKVLHMITMNSVKTCLGMFAELDVMNVDYMDSYEQFGKRLQLGTRGNSVEDSQIAGLLRSNTSKSGYELCVQVPFITIYSCASQVLHASLPVHLFNSSSAHGSVSLV